MCQSNCTCTCTYTGTCSYIVFILDGRAQQYLSLSQGAAISALVQMESVRERD